MLKCARKSVLSTVSTRWTSNARVTSDTVFNAASLVETDSMLGGNGWEIGKRKGYERKGKRRIRDTKSELWNEMEIYLTSRDNWKFVACQL